METGSLTPFLLPSAPPTPTSQGVGAVRHCRLQAAAPLCTLGSKLLSDWAPVAGEAATSDSHPCDIRSTQTQRHVSQRGGTSLPHELTTQKGLH